MAAHFVLGSLRKIPCNWMQVLPLPVFHELREAVNSNRWLSWDQVCEMQAGAAVKLPVLSRCCSGHSLCTVVLGVMTWASCRVHKREPLPLSTQVRPV